eukprot:1642511-Alexandrium_andersonii.AAC.1
MSASLVGSEMCIRDRPWWVLGRAKQRAGRCSGRAPRSCVSALCPSGAVSYTHLTLPTICSV